MTSITKLLRFRNPILSSSKAPSIIQHKSQLRNASHLMTFASIRNHKPQTCYRMSAVSRPRIWWMIRVLALCLLAAPTGQTVCRTAAAPATAPRCRTRVVAGQQSAVTCRGHVSS